MLAVSEAEAKVVTTSSARPHSVISQEPITDVPSPDTLFSKRLPPDVMQHRMTDDVAIAWQTLTALNCSGGDCTGGPLMVFTHAGSRNSTTDIPNYYGQASDPVYVITGGAVPTTPAYNPLNKGFHAPNRARTNGADGEDFFMVWDQVQDEYFTFYRFGGGGASYFHSAPAPSAASIMLELCPILAPSA